MRGMPVITVAMGLLCGAMLHVGAAEPRTSTRDAPDPALDPQVAGVRSNASQPEEEICSGAGRGDIEATFLPTRTRATPAGEILTTRLSVETRWTSSATLTYEYYLTDARGTTIRRGSLLSTARVAPAGAWTDTVDLPAGLEDGYYRVHLLLIAAVSEEVNEVQAHDVYFQVTGGSYFPMDSEDWYERSGYLAAIR